jgi:hypothetical protein
MRKHGAKIAAEAAASEAAVGAGQNDQVEETADVEMKM